jgi:hypothetical protein
MAATDLAVDRSGGWGRNADWVNRPPRPSMETHWALHPQLPPSSLDHTDQLPALDTVYPSLFRDGCRLSVTVPLADPTQGYFPNLVPSTPMDSTETGAAPLC